METAIGPSIQLVPDCLRLAAPDWLAQFCRLTNGQEIVALAGLGATAKRIFFIVRFR